MTLGKSLNLSGPQKPFTINPMILVFKSFPKSIRIKNGLLRVLMWRKEKFHRIGEWGGVAKKLETDLGDHKQLPDITSVCISEEGDNLGYEVLTWTHFQVGRQTMSHLLKYLLASTE